jgi:hypothetical protein
MIFSISQYNNQNQLVQHNLSDPKKYYRALVTDDELGDVFLVLRSNIDVI